VSNGLSFDAKEQVRQATDIVDLVGSYLQLRREGRGYKALCPWHNDSRPSLQVNPERQSFKCWVCDIGGDVFSFIMKMESVEFPEALAMLADRAGIKLPKRGGGDGGPEGAFEEKRLLYQAMAWAEQQFHDFLLRSPDADKARQYLKSRGITSDSAKQFHLGYSPDSWSWLLDRARDTRFTPKVLETIGLAIRKEGGGYYDRFRGRVLFSIRDVQGRPVGVGGRILPGVTDPAKYINSPETPLFSKSNLLYGLDQAKDALSKSRTAVVMEGYTDCLVAHQCGFRSAVAVLGTALGERHIKLLQRFVDRIVLVLDGDDAGRRRTDQILELFVAEHVDLRILTLPDELDPCDFLLERGAQAFEELLSGAVDALEHKFRTATGLMNGANDTFSANKALEEVLSTIAKAPRLQANTTAEMKVKENLIFQKLARKFGLPEAEIRARVTEIRRTSKRPAAAVEAKAEPIPPREESGKHVLAERWLLEIVIQQPDCLAEVRARISAEQFTCPRRRQIFAKLCEVADRGIVPSFERLMLEIDAPEVKTLLVELDEGHRAKNRSDLTKELRDLVQVLGERRTVRPDPTRTAAEVPLAAASNDLVALRHIIERERSRQGISRPTDG
jgi:DNA primase